MSWSDSVPIWQYSQMKWIPPTQMRTGRRGTAGDPLGRIGYTSVQLRATLFPFGFI
jgi:hypothetical protein